MMGHRFLDRRTRRRGTATLELAVALPLLAVLVFGAIEAVNVIFLKQAITIAAYEGVRTASSRGATEAAARRKCQDALQARGIRDAQITIIPAVEKTTPTGTVVRVQVTAPTTANSLGLKRFFRRSQISSFVTMVRL